MQNNTNKFKIEITQVVLEIPSNSITMKHINTLKNADNWHYNLIISLFPYITDGVQPSVPMEIKGFIYSKRILYPLIR